MIKVIFECYEKRNEFQEEINPIVAQWAAGTSQFSAVQERFEEVVSSMIETLLPGLNEYGQEKFIKCCREQVCYLERLLLCQKGLHPGKLGKLTPYQRMTATQTLKEIEKVMMAHVNRMFRNTAIFLCNCPRSAVKPGGASDADYPSTGRL